MAVQRLSTGLSSLVVGVILMVALFATGSHGQSASLLANSVPLSNDVYEAYFGDGQSTTPIGNRLPECLGGTSDVANLSLKLENIVTNQVIQQMAITGRIGGIIWNPTLFPTVLSTLSGRYVCTIFSSSFMATHSDTYQLNVVVPMNITCAFPPDLNLFYDSMNTLSCNVTGNPQPMISWSGINQTIPVNQTTPLSDGTTSITSTVAFEGYEIASDTGDFVTINFTAQYPPFNCTSLQNPSPMSVCNAIPKSETYSRTLQVVGGCPAFNNASWSPSNSSIAYSPTRINISCALGHTGSNTTTVYCQVNGSWTTFPTCAGIDECVSMPCRNNGTCMDEVNRYSCLCKPGYTGLNCETCIDECLSMPCKNGGTCVDEVNRYSCLCEPGYTGQTCETGITTDTVDSLPGWVIPVAVVGGIALIVIVIVIVLCLVKSKNNRKTPDTEPLPQPSPKSKAATETEDQYDTFVRNDGRQPQQVTDPSADPDHYDTFHHPDQQEPGTAPSARPDTYDHIVLNKSIPAEGETYDHLDREQIQAIKQGQQPGQQSAAATALSTQQAANPRVDTSYSMVDMSKKSSRPLLV